MIDHLKWLQIIVGDVLRPERPLEVKTQRIYILVLKPASLLKCFFHSAISSGNNEHFGRFVKFLFFLPHRKVCDVHVAHLLVRLQLWLRQWGSPDNRLLWFGLLSWFFRLRSRWLLVFQYFELFKNFLSRLLEQLGLAGSLFILFLLLRFLFIPHLLH